MRTNFERVVGGAPVTVACLGGSIAYYLYLGLVAARSGAGGQGAFFSLPIEVLMRYGASYPEGVWAGGWQRFVLPMFMHVGIFHLGINMWSLFQLGPPAEAHFGSSNYGTIYLLSGVGGVCMSLLLGGHVSVGASTCLFGILGALLAVQVFACWDWRSAWKSADVRRTAFWIAFNFVLLGFAIPNIDNWGHLGGLLAGVLYGGLFEYWRKQRRISVAVLVLLLSITAGAVCLCRWTFYSPYYHVCVALQDEEAGRPAEAQRHFAEARAWAQRWPSKQAGTAMYNAAVEAQDAGDLARRDEYLHLVDEVAGPGFLQRIVHYKVMLAPGAGPASEPPDRMP